MTLKTAFILNCRSGAGNGSGKGGDGDDWLDTHRAAIEAAAAGGPVSVVEDGEQIRAAVEQALALGCEAVVAGGGDGTLNAVASLLVGRPVAFGVLPLGTLNHFAKDLGIPLEVDPALAAIAAGHTVEIDVGEVGGRYFLNNSSLGLYVDIVRHREKQQQRLGRGKWPAFAWAAWGALRRWPVLTVALTVDGRACVLRTPFVFVGNNVYRMEGFHVGERDGLCDGVLSVYVAGRAGRWPLFVLGLRALVGRLRQAKDFRAFAATELRIETTRPEARIATDGEVCRLPTPLHYRIHPRALRVIVPAAPPA